MATAIQIPTHGDYPTLVIQDREDARILCEILARNEYAVNVREARPTKTEEAPHA